MLGEPDAAPWVAPSWVSILPVPPKLVLETTEICSAHLSSTITSCRCSRSPGQPRGGWRSSWDVPVVTRGFFPFLALGSTAEPG